MCSPSSEKRINDAMRKENVEKLKWEALEKLKQKCAAALANFYRVTQSNQAVVTSIQEDNIIGRIRKFNDSESFRYQSYTVLFEKKKFVRIESVPAGRHCNKAGESDNKKTLLDRDAAEVTFYEDRIKEIKALHDELSKIMKEILPYVQTPPDQTGPRQGPGYSGHLVQVPNQYDPVSPWFESPGRHWEGPS